MSQGDAELCGFATAHGGKASLTEEADQILSRLRLRTRRSLESALNQLRGKPFPSVPRQSREVLLD